MTGNYDVTAETDTSESRSNQSRLQKFVQAFAESAPFGEVAPTATLLVMGGLSISDEYQSPFLVVSIRTR